MHGRLDNVLSQPGGAVGPNGERRHLVREITSELHVGEQGGQSVVDGIVVGREESAGSVGGVAPALVVSLVLALVLVAAVGEFDEERLGRSRQQFPVEDADDLVALFPRLHAGEADAPALAASVAQHPGRDDSAVLVEHVVQVLFGDVGRQVGQVQIGWILLLLLLAKQNVFFSKVARRWRDKKRENMREMVALVPTCNEMY